jgi:hypothetical protein
MIRAGSTAMSLFEPIFATLENEQVRYVVVGGMATVLHGYARLTADVDLMIDQRPEEAVKALRALRALGLCPRAPVKVEDYADATVRQTWFEEKGMRVLSLWDPQQPMREVDLFVENPIEFDLLYERSQLVPLTTTSVRIASIEDLIQLKRLANRPEDQRDIQALQAIRRRKHDG